MLQILCANTLREALCLRMKNVYLKGSGLGHVTHFEILGHIYIYGTVKDRNFEFVRYTYTDHNMY